MRADLEDSEKSEVENKLQQSDLGAKDHSAAVISRLADYLRNNPSQFLTRDQLAEKVYMSPSHFSRVCKSVLGMTPRQLMASVKRNHACDRLRNTDMSVKEVSASCGFPTQDHFSSWFKKQTGQSPSAFRQSV